MQGCSSFPACSVFNNAVPDSYRKLFWSAHLVTIDSETNPDESIITLKSKKIRRLALVLDGAYPRFVDSNMDEQVITEEQIATNLNPLLTTLCERVWALPPYDSAAVAPSTSDDDAEDAKNTDNES